MMKKRRSTMMQFIMVASVYLLLFDPLAHGDELARVSLDNASSLGTEISTDASVKKEGNVERENPTPALLGLLSLGVMPGVQGRAG